MKAYLESCVRRDLTIDQVMKNYIWSLASYVILNYILGFGDRHLSNVMINNEGKFFHIDFGYLFGQEPIHKILLSTEVWISGEMILFLTPK